ncbi:alpha/beta fold hydrolase [Rhodoferax ferrireducens]|uniref:alpha/beta fold hydrolase n=1 Tax=Rhodoferax ferrireducens TaxID=192843 RepID=UPI000E0D2EE7|nr:alpha/beta hydrolase [Rhodoferax ferrireducens]
MNADSYTSFTWIFLRGLTRESRHWGDFVGQFQQALPDSRVVTLDLPGNGQLNQQRSPLRVQDMVAHCRAQLAARQIAPPYHVLAMSLGAMVAAAWAQAYPQELAANVLINTSMRPFNPIWQRLRPSNYGVLAKLVLLGGTPEVWERSILRITSNHAIDDVLPRWLALRRDRPVSRGNALRQLVAAAGFRASGVKPLVPTLLLASAQDHLVSVECSKTLARHWQCDLRLHPSAGHDLPLDDGPWVAAQVRVWLFDSAAYTASAHE